MWQSGKSTLTVFRMGIWLASYWYKEKQSLRLKWRKNRGNIDIHKHIHIYNIHFLKQIYSPWKKSLGASYLLSKRPIFTGYVSFGKCRKKSIRKPQRCPVSLGGFYHILSTWLEVQGAKKWLTFSKMGLTLLGLATWFGLDGWNG